MQVSYMTLFHCHFSFGFMNYNFMFDSSIIDPRRTFIRVAQDKKICADQFVESLQNTLRCALQLVDSRIPLIAFHVLRGALAVHWAVRKLFHSGRRF